ncbi:hypothetical protein [Bradyrhizobium sp. SSUT77]|nr:hypothetical protein [Bradyrhizobium sp. SSUT77]MDH2347379.1 hypothetical protein [Bradyrhizobium sp. SSUT77]
MPHHSVYVLDGFTARFGVAVEALSQVRVWRAYAAPMQASR